MRDTLFFHIPKTGGSSFVREVGASYETENYSESVVKRGTDAELVSAHVPFHFLEPLMKKRYSFTVLRDPVDRVWSFARYKAAQVGNDHHPPDEFLFDDGVSSTRQMYNRLVTQLGGDFYEIKKFRSAVEPLDGHVRNLATMCYPGQKVPFMTQWYDRALYNLDRLDGVFFLEDPKWQEKLWDAVGLPFDGEVFHNVTPIKEDMTDERMQRCLEITQLDRMFYNAAREEYMVEEKSDEVESGVTPALHAGL